MQDCCWKVIGLLDEHSPLWEVVLKGVLEDVEQVRKLRGILPCSCSHNNHHGLLESVEPLSAS